MESLSWKSHPARERPLATILVVLIISLLLLIVYYLTEKNILMLVMAALIMLISLSTFFFPTTYAIDSKKVTIKYQYTVKERNLTAFRSYFPEQRGILLSPYLSASRLENFRGFYLRYDKNNKAEVDTFVKKLFESQIDIISEPAEENS